MNCPEGTPCLPSADTPLGEGKEHPVCLRRPLNIILIQHKIFGETAAICRSFLEIFLIYVN